MTPYVHDSVEGLRHLMYDDLRTRCGVWVLTYKKELHKLEYINDGPATCIVCAQWQPQPLDKPLWRPPEWG